MRSATPSRLLCALGCALGCDASPASPEAIQIQGNADPVPAQVVGLTPRLFALGEVAGNDTFELRLKRIKTCSVESHFHPPAGVRKLGIELEIKSLTDAELPINAFYASLANRDGDRFEPTLAGCKPALEARRIGAGETASGWVSFDVPETLKEGVFRYAPVVIGRGKPELAFAIQP